jgi:16S rRNA (adenine1518-N6/adenine1519-N6)-dimethyltransferase
VVRSAFQFRRKTLRRALKAGVPGAEPAFEAVGIDPVRRGETLSAAEFVALANAIAATRDPQDAALRGS